MQACQLGYRAALERLLTLGVFVSTGQNKSGNEFKGYTPLLLAIKASSVEIVSTLMDSKTTVVTRNPPPLFLAVEEYARESNVENRKKRREIVELLLPRLNIQLHSSYKRTDLMPKLEPTTQRNLPPAPIHQVPKCNPVPPVSTGHQRQKRDLTSSLPSTSREIPQNPTSITPPVRPTATASHPGLPPPAPPPPPARVRSSISKGSARQIERLSRSGKDKDPPLTFHTLDFAGQKLYRPMHHCFITRRAMYIVVFNLQVLVKDLNEKREDSLRKIQYWLNNVYAHSQTAKGESMTENKPKIFLVRTHCSPDNPSQGNKLTKQELKTVHSALKAEFLDKECDDRFLDCIVHQCDEKKRSVRCFFPVENLLTEKMRDQSGMIVLQEHIKKHAGKLSFLKEVSPVSWLKFEEVLLKERESKKKTPLATTRADVKKWAEECGVPDFMTALTFFHDTGLVIDQGLHPDNSKLSSTNTDDGHDSIVVLLDPQWLAMIMAAVIELRTGNEDYDQKALKQLEKTGTVRPDILRQCWKDLLHNNDSMFDKICQILKIYYLLWPINTKFLIPTMLPAGKVDFSTKYMKFYFEFPLYLPEEVYTHLVCVFLERPHKSHKLTATSFSVCSVYGINWKVSLKADKQRLEVKASFPHTSCDNRTPFVVIKLFHEQFLSVVCQGNMLGCLAYNGGPLAKCEECSFNGVVPCVVQPENGESESATVRCPSDFCSNKFNVNELIMRYVEHNQQTKPTVPHVESDASSQPPLQQVKYMYETKYVNIVESGASANFSQTTPAGDHSISYTSSTPAIGATPPAQQYSAHVQNSNPQVASPVG